MPPLLTELVGESPATVAVRAKLRQLLGHDREPRRRPPPVLLQGETGTGKGLLARLIHREGPRREGPFVDINCAAIPATLLEAELFGFERGAFTGAHHAKPGLFEAAHRGILFLDEIGLLPSALQPKLLKVIEEQAVRRLGSTRSEPVDVWILAASSQNLAAGTAACGFREDLYHRLAVMTVFLPPLRERREDIGPLADHLLAHARADYGLSPRTLAVDARAALLSYGWPGNVRELSNVLERAALLTDGPMISVANLGLPTTAVTEPPSTDPAAPAALDFDDAVTSVECERSLDALRVTSWNVTRAAGRLGISRARLRYRIEKYGLKPGAPSPRPRARRRRPAPSAVAPATAPPSPLQWGHRHVALLRADLVFESPAGVVSDTSRDIELLVEKVRSFGGQIQELGPRTSVAAFGLGPVEDAASRAALAAMAIQNVVTRTRGLNGAGVKLAVHVTQPLVAWLDGHPQIDLDGMSAATETLKALISLGEPDTIVASEAAVPFLERRFELVRADRGAGATARPYRVTRRESTGFGLGGRALSRFIGREQELQSLRDRLAQVEQGHGRVVEVAGEAGVGKSRLVYEFTRSPSDRPWRMLASRAVSYGTNTPYLPIIDLLKHYFQIEDRDARSQTLERVTEKVLSLDPGLAPYVPALVSLLDGDAQDHRWQSLEPLQRREQTLDAIKRLLIRESQVQPLCLVFEDLHWIDTETQAAVGRLIDSLPNVRILLLLTYRPEYRSGWGKTYSTQLRLDPLEPERTEELLRTFLGADPHLSPLERLLIERTQGNPFFLEESVRGLVESQTLVGERGAYRLTKPVNALQAPATVQAVLAARINQLASDEATLLQTASVIGAEVSFTLLQALAKMPEDKLRRSLEHLQAAEFLYERSLFPALEYTFKHALTHEVAYKSLPPERRRALHTRIVEAIESLYADRLAEHVELLAHHCFEGEIWEKAALYLRQAGMKAARGSANREAVPRLEQALVALGHLPESRARIEQAIDVRFELRRSFLALGEYGRMLEHLHEAEALAQALGDRQRLGWVLIYLAGCLNWMGDPSGALDCGQRVLVLAADLGDADLQAINTGGLGMVHYALGNYRQARALFIEGIGRLRGDVSFKRFGPAALPAVYARSCLARCLSQLGHFADGAVHGEEAVRLAETADHPFSLVIACLALGSVQLLKGDLPRAIRALDRAVDLCRKWTIPAWFPAAASSLGYAYVLSGRRADGIVLLREAIDLAAHMRIGYDEAPTAAWLSEAHLLEARRDEAVSQAQRQVDRSRQCGHRGHEAYGLRALAEVAARFDPHEVETAKDYYHRALTLATELGMRPLVAHCHRGLGRLYERTGKSEQAREHLTTAVTMYHESGMRWWLEQAEREKGEVR